MSLKRISLQGLLNRIFSLALVLLIFTAAVSNVARYSSISLLPPIYSTSTAIEESGSRIRLSEISIPEIHDNNTSASMASVGQSLTLSVSIFNFEAMPIRFQLSFEIRSMEKDGVTEATSLQSGLLDSHLKVEEIAMPWTPSRAGNYELRSFAISYSGNDNSSSIIGISPLKTKVITVEPSSVCLPAGETNIESGEAPSPGNSISNDRNNNHVLPIQSVIANSYDYPYFPHNIADGDLNTRWSGGAVNSWVLLDLGRQSSLCSAEIAWHNESQDGQETTGFAISASNDGSRFVDAYVGRSGNASLAFERYHIDELDGRFVKVTVYSSNIEGKELAGISEVAIHGFPNIESDDDIISNFTGSRPSLEIISPVYGEMITGPPNTVAIKINGTVYSGSGIQEVMVRIDRHSYESASLTHIGNSTTWNLSEIIRLEGRHTITARATDIHGRSNWETMPIDVLFDYETSETDKFGVQMIYATKDDGEEWYMNMRNPFSDQRFTSYASLKLNDDGSWRVTDDKVRLDVATSSGYHPERIASYSQKKLELKGYMQDTNDWRNVEITGFVRVNKVSIDDEFSWYARGGKHTDGTPCEGTSIKNNLSYSGRVRVAKEQWHEGGYTFTEFSQAMSSLHDRWIGFKTVIYNSNEDNNSSTDVVIETWVNENEDKITWKKISTTIDSGNWGTEGDYCAGSPDQVITWGGPIAAFRWDNADDVDVKWLSVREIQVNGKTDAN
jgi:hypothetical protein